MFIRRMSLRSNDIDHHWMSLLWLSHLIFRFWSNKGAEEEDESILNIFCSNLLSKLNWKKISFVLDSNNEHWDILALLIIPKSNFIWELVQNILLMRWEISENEITSESHSQLYRQCKSIEINDRMINFQWEIQERHWKNISTKDFLHFDQQRRSTMTIAQWTTRENIERKPF